MALHFQQRVWLQIDKHDSSTPVANHVMNLITLTETRRDNETPTWYRHRTVTPPLTKHYTSAWILETNAHGPLQRCLMTIYTHTLKKTMATLIMKPTRCTNFYNLLLEWNSICFGQFLCPSLGVFNCTHSNGVCLWQVCWQLASSQQTCMTYTIAVCTVRNSWWWRKELSETCRVSFQE